MNKDKLEELLNMTKLAELVNTKQKDDEKKCNTVLWVLAIVGAVAAVAGIAYAVYRFLTPDYLEDFDDDFFEDEEEETPEKKEEEDTEE